jgi:hypothetical protein
MNGSLMFDAMILLFVLIAVPTFIISVLIERSEKKDRKR